MYDTYIMPPHVLPDLLKIGQYRIDKLNFTLTHENQRKDSTGRKRRIEYPCDSCGKFYVTKLRDEMEKKDPWLCRSCRVIKDWKRPEYRNAIMSGITEETRMIRQKQLSERSKKYWNDPQKRLEMSMKLRARPAEVYSRARRSMRKSKVFQHWKSQQEIICVGSYEASFVEWCNRNEYDFDWQIPHTMPNGRKYIIDAKVHDGPLAGFWIEIKGYMSKIGEEKWKWFHKNNPNDSKILMQEELKALGIL
jgi:hypothetical protein